MKNFTIEEFRCPCCGENHVKPEFLQRIDYARDIAGIPFIITSGYRCKDHNIMVGGSDTSSHLTGYAADIRAESSHQKYKIVMSAESAGLTRIGVYKTFIHLDCDPDKSSELLFRGDY